MKSKMIDEEVLKFKLNININTKIKKVSVNKLIKPVTALERKPTSVFTLLIMNDIPFSK